MPESTSPDRLLRLQANINLQRHEGIKKALDWFHDNPTELKERTEEFDSALSALRRRLIYTGTDWNRYQHAEKLIEALGENELPPSLKRASELVAEGQGKNLIQNIQDTFSKVNDLLSGDWSWAANLSPHRSASGLLIEGYGLMAEDSLKIPGFRRIFVEAFEEELILNHEDSPMLKDVIGWMEEEKNSFSPIVQEKINSIKSNT